MHVLRGEFPVFFWGQAYMGSAEAYLHAVVFQTAGAGPVTLRIKPLAVGIAEILAVYGFARMTGDRRLALGAAAFFSLAPPFLLLHSISAKANHNETLLLGTLVFLGTVRLLGEEHPVRRQSRSLALGFLAGFAWWTHILIVYYLVPAVLALLWLGWARMRWRKGSRPSRVSRGKPSILDLQRGAFLGVVRARQDGRDVRSMEESLLPRGRSDVIRFEP